jgi:diaminopimelate decarboxylase
MKASPNAAILGLFNSLGLNIDASSGYEVRRAVTAGIPYANISLSSQELPDFFPELVKAGLKINACSLSQLDRYGAAFPGGEIGLRFNPGARSIGSKSVLNIMDVYRIYIDLWMIVSLTTIIVVKGLGSGGTGKTNVGGPSSSFGIWHELLPEVKEIVARHSLKVVRVHTHIGSGSDPSVWQRVSGMSIDLCRHFPSVTTLNLGGGFKARCLCAMETHTPSK